MKNKHKDYDCVQMKNDIQVQLYKQLKPVSIDDYFNKLRALAKKSDIWKQISSQKGTVVK